MQLQIDVETALLRSWPIRLRLRHGETLDSYSKRYMSANAHDEFHKREIITRVRKARPGLSKVEAWRAFIASSARIDDKLLRPTQPTHADGSTCDYCTAGLPAQWMCRLCAHGDEIQLNPHMNGNVCLRHNLWVGPGASPAEQFAVGAEHLRAERQFQRLKASGDANAVTFMELHFIVSGLTPLNYQTSSRTFARDLYPTVMAIWTALLDPTNQVRFLNPQRTYAESYQELARVLGRASNGTSNAVIDGVWLLMRPVALSVREHLIHPSQPITPWAHDLRISSRVLAAAANAPRPLEPFSRYLNAVPKMRDEVAARWQVLLHRGRPGQIRADLPHNYNSTVQLICARGHRIETNVLKWHGNATTFSCGYCTRRRVAPGETDITSTHPRIAAEFDPESNPGVRIDHLLGGANIWLYWKCQLGHKWEAMVNDRTQKGTGCPTCAGFIAEPGFNTLLETDPLLIRHWHPTLNHITPDMVTRRMSVLVWWHCDRGHEARGRPVQGFRSGRPCLVDMPEWARAPERRLRSCTLIRVSQMPASRARWGYCRGGG